AVGLTDSPAWVGSASASAPLRMWKSINLPRRSKSMRRSGANGVTGRCTSPGWKAGMRTGLAELKGSPAVRLGVEDAELLELPADVGLALCARGRQRRARGADRAAHDHHAALERG